MKEVARVHASGVVEEKGNGYRIMHRTGQGDVLSNVNKDRIVAEKRDKPATRKPVRTKKQRKG